MTRGPRPLRTDDATPLAVAGLCNISGQLVRVVRCGPHLSFSVPVVSGRTRKNVRRHVPLVAE